jgi:hypothetical protein
VHEVPVFQSPTSCLLQVILMQDEPTVLNRQTLQVFLSFWNKISESRQWITSGTYERHHLLHASMSCFTVSGRIPLLPFASTLILNARSLRVLSGVRGCPTPAAWDRIKFSCSLVRFSWEI